MFLETSRYFRLTTMTVKLPDGRTVVAVEPRGLPSPVAEPFDVKGNDRLDVIAQRHYRDGTRFWHIADANSQLEARLLVEPAEVNTSTPPMTVIQVPRN